MSKKKVLILSSSPRKGGNSDTLCNEFMRGACESGHDVEKVCLRDMNIKYCTGCGVCSNLHQPCPQKDDAGVVVQKMIDADVIVLATPVYFYTLSAQLKTLIDRTCARYTEISGKDFYLIATMAETDMGLMERTFESMRGFLDCLDGATEKGLIAASGVWQKGEVNSSEYMQSAYIMGKKV
ncbi:MAG: flavodoxin family protein [Bacteroides sp.]|nr:flavodoxin family protein [Roseburia sp.]MCM1345584.1 flavodoxin family protein [Bacteroides sp.]MCM1421261.1 flavodoxin family protein [Bacteroides sp.]